MAHIKVGSSRPPRATRTSPRSMSRRTIERQLTDLLRKLDGHRGKPGVRQTRAPDHRDLGRAEPDSGEAVGLGPARLTVNIGFGPGLFGVDGPDRFSIADRWPIQLADLPAYPGDALHASTAGGDLTMHACADDPQVAFHAVRQLVRAGAAVTSLRWSQSGFNEADASHGTPRNLLGFKDGTSNPSTNAELAEFVWAGTEAPEWMVGGTYLVMRRIRVSLEHWDAQTLRSQERTIGRHKVTRCSTRSIGRSSTRSTSRPRMRQVAPSFRSTPTFGSPHHRRTGARPCCAAAIRTATPRPATGIRIRRHFIRCRSSVRVLST